MILLALTSAFFVIGTSAQAAAADNIIEGSGIKIEFKYGAKRFVYIDKKIEPTNHLVAEEISMSGIDGSYAQKRAIMSRCLNAGASYKTAVLYTMPLLERVVNTVIKAVDTPAYDSEIEFNPDQKPMFTITREAAGLNVNEERLYADIYEALAAKPVPSVTVKPDPVRPKVTAEDNVQITRLRTSYSTDCSRSSENRRHNIKLALKKINGTVLRPGEEFSFNKIVGARTERCGFKEAKIIRGGNYENGIGGGVCQVSTTVYNAALLGGMSITSVRNHSLACSYELPSFDAMVNSGSTDLRFKNNGQRTVFIRAYATDTSAVVEIYGSEMEYLLKRKSEVISRKDAPETERITDTEYKHHSREAKTGDEKIVQRPHGEMKSVGYLLYYDKKGLFIKQEKIREDTYKSCKGIIAVAP